VSLLTGMGAEKEFVDALCRRYPTRIPDAVEFALQDRVLLLQTEDGIPLDIALAAFPFAEQVVQRATDFRFLESVELRTSSAEDLVLLKAFGDRSRDWADIEGVLIRQGRVLDRRYVERHLGPLCELKGQPDITLKLAQLWDRRVQ
jgi:hypothetical protein